MFLIYLYIPSSFFLALPSAPTLHLESATSDSISVGWTKVDSGNSEIKRFVINFKKAHGGLWEERSAGKHVTSFAIAPLACGTAYQVWFHSCHANI